MPSRQQPAPRAHARVSLASSFPTGVPSENLRTLRATREWRPRVKRHELVELGARPAAINATDGAWEAKRCAECGLLVTAQEITCPRCRAEGTDEQPPVDTDRLAVLGERERICVECHTVLLPSGACGYC